MFLNACLNPFSIHIENKKFEFCASEKALVMIGTCTVGAAISALALAIGNVALFALAGVGSLFAFYGLSCHFRRKLSHSIKKPVDLEQNNLKSSRELWRDISAKTMALNIDYVNDCNVRSRFDDVQCPEDSAVKINEKYLHANIVGSRQAPSEQFIASQAPLDFELFWEAVYQNATTIIDLTDHTQVNEREYAKKANLPQGNGIEVQELTSEKSIFGNLTLQKYTYEVRKDGEESKIISRYHFENWADFGSVQVKELKDLINLLKESNKNKNGIRAVVHCRAGVGRTGTLITAFILAAQIEQGLITSQNFEEALVKLVVELRSQRGPMFVQNSQQFDLLYNFGKDLLDFFQNWHFKII